MIRAALLSMLTATLVACPSGGYTPVVSDALDEVIAHHGASRERKVVVFDFDNTLIFNDIGYATLQHYVEARLFDAATLEANRLWSPELLARYRQSRSPAELESVLAELLSAYRKTCREQGKLACYKWLAAAFAGVSPQQLTAEVRNVIDKELGRELCDRRLASDPAAVIHRGIRIYEPQRRLIERLHAAGFEVWIVSASFQDIVRTFAPRFGVSPERTIGVRLVLEDGRYSERIEEPFTYREGKVEAIERFIGARPLMVFGDAITDKEMLDYASALAVLIDRGRPEMLEHARAGGWRVQKAFVDPASVPACSR